MFDWKIVAVVAVLLSFGVGMTMLSSSDWNDFVDAHACKVVGIQSSNVQTVTGISSSGSVVTSAIYNPAKTGWLCDDGVTYWR